MSPQAEIESLKARLAELENAPPPANNELQTVVGGPWGLDSQGRTTLNGTRIVGALNRFGFTATLHYPDDIGSRWKEPAKQSAKQSNQEADVEAPSEEPPVKRAGPKGREIYVIEIGPEYEGVLKTAEYGSVDQFESAAEAAQLLGVTPGFLSQEFKKAAGNPVNIRGVTMQYLDLYLADDSNFSQND